MNTRAVVLQPVLAALGISQSPRRLALTASGREHVLTLTSPVGTDWGSAYVLREDGRVFLLGLRSCLTWRPRRPGSWSAGCTTSSLRTSTPSRCPRGRTRAPSS